MGKTNYLFRITFYIISYYFIQLIFNLPAFPPIGKLIGFFYNYENVYALVSALLFTLSNWLKVFLLSSIFALLLGVLLGVNKKISSAIAADLDFWRSLPATVLVLFAMAVFGDNFFTRSMPAGYVTFFIILYYTNKASILIDCRKIEHLKELGASNRIVVFEGYIPEMLPMIMISIRQALSLSLLILVSTELIIGSHGGNGVGQFIIDELNSLNYTSLIVCMLALGFIGYLINYLGYFLNKKIVPWAIIER